METQKPARKRPAGTTTRGSKAKRATAVTPVPGRVPVEAPPDKCFWVNHGPILKNLSDLRDALGGWISDAQFAYHVNAERNDFAGWVEAVLLAPEVAAAMRRAKTRVGVLRAVKKYLAD